MKYIFLSPHLDDVSLSCGGIVNQLSGKNFNIEIWSIFSGSPESKELPPFALSLHNRWKLPVNAPKKRRLEDIEACKVLGAAFKHFHFLDCIYRKDNSGDAIIQKEEDLYQPIPKSQLALVEEISSIIKSQVMSEDIIVSPLAIGDHLDHKIIFQSIMSLNLQNLFFYEDYPYVIKTQNNEDVTEKLLPLYFHLDDNNIQKWYQSIAAYKSQISTFWIDLDHMKSEISHFYEIGGGKNLWK